MYVFHNQSFYYFEKGMGRVIESCFLLLFVIFDCNCCFVFFFLSLVHLLPSTLIVCMNVNICFFDVSSGVCKIFEKSK